MLQIVILCVAALFVGNCESAEFEVLIDGTNVGRSSSCIGENVIYVCNITSISHMWNVLGSSRDRTLVWNSRPVTDGEYTFRVVSVDGTNIITSSLSVISSAGLNGINITCAVGFDTDSPRATTVAMVLDPPSLPELDVNQLMEDNETVNITVTPPLVSPECVLQYNIITYSNCESIETNITMYPNNTNSTLPVQFTRGGLNLCTCSYNFTAVAVTRNGIGERNDPVTTNKVSDIVGNPDLNIAIDRFKVTVSINPQEPSVFVDVKRSTANDTNCVINVERNTNITSSETTLDCSFAELTPTFCVQFIDGSCQSELVQITTATKLPSLLSGVNITSSTSSIDVIVDVNEGINCDTSQLSTRTTISNEMGFFNMNTSSFEDQVIVFEPPSPGVYTCRVFIMNGTTILKSRDKSCSNIDTSTEDSSESSVPIIVGCVAAGVLAILILIVVIVVLIKKGCCEKCCCESCEESCCKEKKSSSHSNNNATTTSITVDGSQDPNSTDGKHKDPLLSMYQDPNTIKHEAAAGGEVYTMVEKKPKTKKGKEEKDDVAVMYSMPDKSKKNPELTYADVQVSNPQRPLNNRGIGNRSVFQQDTSSVTYASVESPTTKF